MATTTHHEERCHTHTTNDDTVSFPLPEIIGSGRLSSDQFVLENEDWSAARVAAAMAAASEIEPLPIDFNERGKGGGEINDITSNESSMQTPHFMENSARVALCIVRSFTNSCRLANIVHYETYASFPFPTDPSDYLISLRLGHSSQSPEPPTPSTEGGDYLDFLAEFNWKESGENGAADNRGPHSGTYRSSPTPTSRSQAGNNIAAMTICGTCGSGPTPSSQSQAGNIASLVDQLTGNILSLSPPSSPGRTTRVASDKIANFSSNANWTIMGIMCTAKPETHFSKSDQQHDFDKEKLLTPMQVLGELLYHVFSQGQEVQSSIAFMMESPRATDMPVWNDVESIFSRGNEDSASDRTNKGPRFSKVTIFSRLVESKIFPVSVCRILSDLMTPTTSNDGFVDNGSHQPFTSFGQVMQDLEQMIHEPSTFLHDTSFQGRQGLHRVAMFGERYFGRKEEIKKMITIATKMEEEAAVLEKGNECQEEKKGDNEWDLHSQVMDESKLAQPGQKKTSLDAVFVSGVAGSGKSHLVRTFGNFLSEGTEWIILKCKFERGMEHTSRSIISVMFNELISYLVKMKESVNPSEVKLSQRASESVWNALGGSWESASTFVDTLPNISMLFGGAFNHSQQSDSDVLHDWKLIQSLSKILDAVTELGRFIMICCDDMQWCDKASISFVGELLVSVAGSKRMSRRCLFVGLYRKDEVSDEHPLSLQFSYLQMNSDINTIEIKLPGLTKYDILDMLMSHFCLPQRLVIDLASAVHQKTSGYAFWVVELLNSMMRESTIYYDVQKLRYFWDQDKIDLMQTSEGVAGLIASNISSLPIASQKTLQILSCFGTQTDKHLLHLLDNFQNGILASVDSLIELGILEGAGGIVIFSHDIIQEEVYNSMPIAKRQQLHLDLGNRLGYLESRRSQRSRDSDDLLFFAGTTMTSSLVSLVCDQVNSAIKLVHDEKIGLEYATWNLAAGKEHSNQSNFSAALHYYSHGINFLLKEKCWSANKKLCLGLHEGAAFSSYALGLCEDTIHYAGKILDKLPDEDTLVVWTVLLKSLTVLNKHSECISKGLFILRSLGFDFPLFPTKETIAKAMADVEISISQFGVSNIVNMPAMPQNDKNQTILKIFDSFYGSCMTAASPFLPLAACNIIKHTLKNGICQETSTAFAIYGQFKIFTEDDYVGAKRYADVARAICKKHEQDTRSHMIMLLSIDVFFENPKNLSKQLLTYSKQQKEAGDFHLSTIALGASWHLQIYGGENLSLINKSMHDCSNEMAKSYHAAKFHLLDEILVKELLGSSPSSFRSDHDMRCLQSDAELAKDMRLLLRVHQFKTMISYWRGDFAAAEESSNIAASLYPVSKMPNIAESFHTVSKMPSINRIYFTFFRGLVLFQRYSEDGSDQRLKDGKNTIDLFGVWANINEHSMAIFGNKWFLLQAEYAASTNKDCSYHVEKLYKKSIQAGQDHGIIHEVGMACEMLGSYYVMHGRKADSIQHIKRAHQCYTQWGATAVATKLLHDHDIEINSISDNDLHAKNNKRSR